MDFQTVSSLLNQKKISPVELVKQCLENIKAKNSTYNAIITTCESEAYEAARAAEDEIMRGIRRGPFHGIPIAVKDLIYTKGIRTTMGSEMYRNFVPDYDATVIKKLNNAGAIMIGKAHTHEFAIGPTGDISFFGPCRNPYNPEKIAGGSSSGSAVAIATKMAYAAVGTDTGGSIRIPASACGIVGMKPTFGLVSKYGIQTLANTLDHPGPMSKNVEENAFLLNILAGYDVKDSFTVKTLTEDYTRLIGCDISGKRIGIPSYYYKNIESEVAEKIENVINTYIELGVEVVPVELEEIEEIINAQSITIRSEIYAEHEENIINKREGYHPTVYEGILECKDVHSLAYMQAQQKRKSLIECFNKVFHKVDVLLTPTLPIVPTNIGQREVRISDYKEPVDTALIRLNRPTNFTGNPSLSVPCGFSKNGLPIGFQLIGKHWNEALLYQFGYSYEKKIMKSSR